MGADCPCGDERPAFAGRGGRKIDKGAIAQGSRQGRLAAFAELLIFQELTMDLDEKTRKASWNVPMPPEELERPYDVQEVFRTDTVPRS